MKSTHCKRKPCADISNVGEDKNHKSCKYSAEPIFCSDSWKASNSLAEHLDLEDVLHFPINHSENYVNPKTGAHTQTVEGLWRHCKDFLPTFGMKPKDLGSYLGQFMWHRYAKQRNLDMFLFFLKCASEIYPLAISKLPIGGMSDI